MSFSDLFKNDLENCISRTQDIKEGALNKPSGKNQVLFAILRLVRNSHRNGCVDGGVPMTHADYKKW